MLWEFINFFVFIFFNFSVSCFFLFSGYSANVQEYNSDKLSPYECGFQPFHYNISFFDIKYYLQALLFLIFDLEIMFLLPFIASLKILTTIGFVSGLIFFFILLLGLKNCCLCALKQECTLEGIIYFFVDLLDYAVSKDNVYSLYFEKHIAGRVLYFLNNFSFFKLNVLAANGFLFYFVNICNMHIKKLFLWCP